ncbi:MAG: signal transduction histidine kinase [Candidatus Omnitrophota bacterium]|jgi:signal transduction histidine kinase
MKIIFRSFKLKLGLLFVGTFIILMIIFSTMLYYNLTHTLHQLVSDTLQRQEVVDFLKNRIKFVVLSMIPVAIASIFLARVFVARSMKPFKDLETRLNEINYKDLSFRIDSKINDGEWTAIITAINDMLSRLQQSFSYILEFSSNVSHEIKTPLAIIKGESELALKKERNPKEYQEALNGVIEEVDRIISITDNLLMLSKLDYHPDLLQKEKVNLKEVLIEIVNQCKLLMDDNSKVLLSTKIPKEPFYIEGDIIHLRRLFFNLINNAIKFNRENGSVCVELSSAESKVTVSVRDTGRGIPEEEQKIVFKRFYRSHQPNQEPVPGSGLGLSIAHSIVRLHGGEIHIDSKVGEGSTFFVTLPLMM